MYNVFGATGYVGSTFCNMYSSEVIRQDREDRIPKSNNILYLISTTDNYNVHSNITLDVDTNLRVLCEVLEHCKKEDIVFNFISSWFVYGTVDLPATEESSCNPTGFYSITKKAAEDVRRCLRLLRQVGIRPAHGARVPPAARAAGRRRLECDPGGRGDARARRPRRRRRLPPRGRQLRGRRVRRAPRTRRSAGPTHAQGAACERAAARLVAGL